MMRLLVGTSPKIKATPSGVVSKGFLMPSFLGGLRLLEGQDLFIGSPSPPPLTKKNVLFTSEKKTSFLPGEFISSVGPAAADQRMAFFATRGVSGLRGVL